MADKNISALPNIASLTDDALLVAEQQGAAGNITFGQVRKFAESAAASIQKGEPGEPGKDFQILGYYDTLALLRAAQTSPEAGDAYGVGTAAPYTVYVWDGVNLLDWVDNGTIQGPSGEKGDTGTVFTPHMDNDGNLSWTNDGELENPATVNLKGPQGDAFKYKDFTEEQLANLKGEKGNPFTYDDFTEEQLAALKGEKGDAFTYEDFTEEQLAALVGPKGDPGNSIQSITRTAGTGAPGTTDTYTITYTDNTTSTFSVYNGKDGSNGGTPVKGEDYFTEADKQELVDDLAEQTAPVSYKAQELTDEQKAQARENIGAAETGGVSNEAKKLILSLFKNAAYTADISATIARLEDLWSENGEEDSGDDSGATVTDDGNGNVTVIGLTATDDGDGNVTVVGLTATDDGNGNITVS